MENDIITTVVCHVIYSILANYITTVFEYFTNIINTHHANTIIYTNAASYEATTRISAAPNIIF